MLFQNCTYILMVWARITQQQLLMILNKKGLRPNILRIFLISSVIDKKSTKKTCFGLSIINLNYLHIPKMRNSWKDWFINHFWQSINLLFGYNCLHPKNIVNLTLSRTLLLTWTTIIPHFHFVISNQNAISSGCITLLHESVFH